jgi:hypothetical protein
MANVKDSLQQNYRLSQQSDFEDRMCAAISRRTMDVFRIHPSGDFYTALYVHKWIRIIKRFPQIKFYAYTRSWRKSYLLSALLELAALENVQLWWSADKSTHALGEIPPPTPRVLVAYMQSSDDEPIPAYTDLIFRVKRKAQIRAIDRKPVCPVETGVAYEKGKKPTCSSCKLCYRDRTARPALVTIT